MIWQQLSAWISYTRCFSPSFSIPHKFIKLKTHTIHCWYCNGLMIFSWISLISALSKCFLFPIACPSNCEAWQTPWTPWFSGLPCFSIPYCKCGSDPWCSCCLFWSSARASRSSIASYLLEVIKTGTLLCCLIILMVQEYICYQTHIQL